MISLDTEDHSDFAIPYHDIKNAISVAYDHVEKYVFWTDDSSGTIQRGFLNGTGLLERI